MRLHTASDFCSSWPPLVVEASKLASRLGILKPRKPHCCFPLSDILTDFDKCSISCASSTGLRWVRGVVMISLYGGTRALKFVDELNVPLKSEAFSLNRITFGSETLC